MIQKTKALPVAVLTLILLVALAGLLAACSGNEPTTTTTGSTTGSTSAASTTSTSIATNAPTSIINQTIVVGGSSAEEYESALPDLQKAVDAAPTDLTALQNLAVAQMQSAHLDEAAATYEKMLAIKDDAFTRNNYANVLKKLGKTDEAKAQYQKAIETDPTLAVAYINLAVLLSEQKDNAGALKVLKSGLDKVTGDDKKSLQSYIDELNSPSTTKPSSTSTTTKSTSTTSTNTTKTT
jgi:Tfp pilus assembly protein PilF